MSAADAAPGWRRSPVILFPLAGVVIGLCWLYAARGNPHPTSAPTNSISPDQALKLLQDGNAKFVAGNPLHPHENAERRHDLSGGQHPFAVVLACADSRVPPELIFDTGLGDIFVVRVAGNIADDAVLGSIEYAVDHLGVSLVVVMGHQRCGAVTAAVDAVKNPGAEVPGHLAALIDPIRPAVTSEPPGDDLLDRAINTNVRHVVAQISGDASLAELITAGKLKVVGGRYDLDSGEFVLLTNGPSTKP